jgi:hypothetical protein
LLKHRREDKRERERERERGVCGDFLKALKIGRKA